MPVAEAVSAGLREAAGHHQTGRLAGRDRRGGGFERGAHKHRYDRAGQPADRAAFEAASTPVPTSETACLVVACRFPQTGRDGFCDGHLWRYRNVRHARRDLTPAGYLEHLADARRISAPKFDMRGVPATVALEVRVATAPRRGHGCDGASDLQPGRAMGR